MITFLLMVLHECKQIMSQSFNYCSRNIFFKFKGLPTVPREMVSTIACTLIFRAFHLIVKLLFITYYKQNLTCSVSREDHMAPTQKSLLSAI